MSDQVVSLTEDRLHEIRVNGLLQAFVAQRDAAMTREASLSAEKQVLDARLQNLMMLLNSSSAELREAQNALTASQTTVIALEAEVQSKNLDIENLTHDYTTLQEECCALNLRVERLTEPQLAEEHH